MSTTRAIFKAITSFKCHKVCKQMIFSWVQNKRNETITKIFLFCRFKYFVGFEGLSMSMGV